MRSGRSPEEIDALFLAVEEARRHLVWPEYRQYLVKRQADIDRLVEPMSETLGVPMIHRTGGTPEGYVYSELTYMEKVDEYPYPFSVVNFLFSSFGDLVSWFLGKDLLFVRPVDLRAVARELTPSEGRLKAGIALLESSGFHFVSREESMVPYTGSDDIRQWVNLDLLSEEEQQQPFLWNHLYFR